MLTSDWKLKIEQPLLPELPEGTVAILRQYPAQEHWEELGKALAKAYGVPESDLSVVWRADLQGFMLIAQD